MCTPASLAMLVGEHPHMAIADRPRQNSQASNSRDGRPADPPVSRTLLRKDGAADMRAAQLAASATYGLC